jgi:hypothetical protein
MKNLLRCLLVISVLLCSKTAHAQIYKNAAGLTIDVGDGGTLVGPAIKHFFDKNNALQGEVLFGQGATFLSAMYQYNEGIQNAKGLNYYFGLGPSLGFGGGETAFILRPAAGLDYRIGATPLNLAFDWRPVFIVTGGTQFIAARFGIGLRFSF